MVMGYTRWAGVAHFFSGGRCGALFRPGTPASLSAWHIFCAFGLAHPLRVCTRLVEVWPYGPVLGGAWERCGVAGCDAGRGVAVWRGGV